MTGDPIPVRTSPRYAGHYAGVRDAARLLEIFAESQKLALSSNVPATALGRFELAVEAYHQLMILRLSEPARASVQEAMVTLANRFPVQVCLNEASGLCSKAAKLKSQSRKLEYLKRARDLLAAGIGIVGTGREEVQVALDGVTIEIKALENPAVGAPRPTTRPHDVR